MTWISELDCKLWFLLCTNYNNEKNKKKYSFVCVHYISNALYFSFPCLLVWNDYTMLNCAFIYLTSLHKTWFWWYNVANQLIWLHFAITIVWNKLLLYLLTKLLLIKRTSSARTKIEKLLLTHSTNIEHFVVFFPSIWVCITSWTITTEFLIALY